MTRSLSGRGTALALTWCLLLVALKGAAARWPTDSDDRAFVGMLPRELQRGEVELVMFEHRPGLRLYGIRRMEHVTVEGAGYPFFTKSRTVRDLVAELAAADHATAFVAEPRKIRYVEQLLRDGSPQCACEEPLDVDGRQVLICRVPPPPASEGTSRGR